MLLRLLCLLLAASNVFSYQDLPPISKTETLTRHGYRTVAYYVNWAIYERQYFPQDLPVNKLTHVLYAFANINPDTGEVYLSDSWADTDIKFAGDLADNDGINLYGCLKQLYILKKQNRNLKGLLSIGGWSYSSNFAVPASSISGRSTFASSAVSLIYSLGLDGLDIDWEYPADDTEAAHLVLLLQTIRGTLDAYSNSLSMPYHFQLTVSSPAGPSNYKKLHLAEMDQYIDFWNLMAYDYTGSWSTETGHQANIFFTDNKSTPFDTQTAVDYYMSQGVDTSKIVLGMPVYGRAFNKTKGLGLPFTGVGEGTWEKGIYDFKVLPLTGAIETFDNISGASYSYDAAREEFISYDNIEVGNQKAIWIQKMGLGGGMWWESSGDAVGNKSLIKSVAGLLGGIDGSRLEHTPNQLVYLDTTYNNLRAGMPASVSGSSSVYTSALTSASLISDRSSGAISVPSAAGTNKVIQSTTSNYTAGLSTLVSSSSSKVEPSNTEEAPVCDQSQSGAIIPGKDGVPGCAYILASDLGAGALCSSDYCNCGGTIAPLITWSVSDTLITNCNYQAQPAANSCPIPTTSPPTSTELIGHSVTTTTTTVSFSKISITSVIIV